MPRAKYLTVRGMRCGTPARYAMATPIWAGEHLDVITDRELNMCRGSTFSTMRLGKYTRVIPFSVRTTHSITKDTWTVVSADHAFWYFGSFTQCQQMLDKIEMHLARWYMVQGTMAEGFV